MVGKKQRDIRENNKSLVIDCLLSSEMTTANLEKQLKLSHTALLKVINELKSLNIVRDYDTKHGEKGRPSRVYEINPDCAFAAAICLGEKRIEIFVVDMKGFQVNKYVSFLTFSSEEEFVLFSLNKLDELLKHERTKNKKLSTICISLPFGCINNADFELTKEYVYKSFKNHFINSEIDIKSNNEFWAHAERKYGRLKNFSGGALLCELEGFVSCAFSFNKECYIGKKAKNNTINKLLSNDICRQLESKIKEPIDSIIDRYVKNETIIVKLVNEELDGVLFKVKEIASLLDVDIVLFSGMLAKLGNNFFSHVQEIFENQQFDVSPFIDRSPSFAGAVFIASYDSLKSLL